VQIRFHKLDMLGRVLHAAAQPSIAYLFLLAGLFAITFELFHPSNGPAGVSGAIALAFSGYGIFTLGGNPFGVVLIVLSVIAFSVDLKNESLGPFTFGAIVALIAGSLILFPSPYLKPSPWILAFGIVTMTIFMVSVMTRVLRDLRMVASGELEVRDAHAHLEPENQEEDHDA
jgi:membrane-bound serine protease (ClpP class)